MSSLQGRQSPRCVYNAGRLKIPWASPSSRYHARCGSTIARLSSAFHGSILRLHCFLPLFPSRIVVLRVGLAAAPSRVDTRGLPIRLRCSSCCRSPSNGLIRSSWRSRRLATFRFAAPLNSCNSLEKVPGSAPSAARCGRRDRWQACRSPIRRARPNAVRRRLGQVQGDRHLPAFNLRIGSSPGSCPRWSDNPKHTGRRTQPSIQDFS